MQKHIFHLEQFTPIWAILRNREKIIAILAWQCFFKLPLFDVFQQYKKEQPFIEKAKENGFQVHGMFYFLCVCVLSNIVALFTLHTGLFLWSDRVTFGFGPITHRKNWMVQIRAWPSKVSFWWDFDCLSWCTLLPSCQYGTGSQSHTQIYNRTDPTSPERKKKILSIFSQWNGKLLTFSHWNIDQFLNGYF